MLLEIGIALLVAKLLGFLFEKVKQPAVIGEILTGVLMGPFVAERIFGMRYISPVTEGLGKMGIIILLFISGLEIGVEEIIGEITVHYILQIFLGKR